MAMLIPYLLVGFGGFLGANARFLIGRLVDDAVDTRFPLGTFIINVSGSFLLGVLGSVIAAKATENPDAWRLALGVGFLGAFTTFSAFEFENNVLLEDGSWLLAAINVTASVLAGLMALRGGSVLVKIWWA